MAAFPTTVATDSDLYIAVNALSTQLTDNPLSIGATTVNVTSAALFPTVGFISIDNEIIKYTGKTGTSFTGCTRASDGTSASSHVQNSQVFHNVIAIHHNALKDELIAAEQFISDLIGRTNTQILSPNGSAALPSHSFASDPDTGIFRNGANTLALVAAGSNALQIEGTTQVHPLLPVRGNDGTAGAPAFSFDLDTDTGIFRNGANTMILSAGGVGRLNITSTDVTATVALQITDGVIATPGLAFNNDLDTGIYRPGSNILGIVGGGVEVARFNNNSLEMRNSAILYVVNGSAAAPALTFATTPTTGIFNNGTNSFRIAVNGVQMFSIDTATINLEVASLHLFGTAANPGISWGGDADTGIIRDAANSMGFVCGGTKVLVINSTPQLSMANGTNNNPSYSFINGSNSGMYYDGTANTIRFSAGGTLGISLNTTDVVIGAGLSINSNRILPNADNSFSVGTAGSRYTTIFATTGTINTSHSSTKQNIVDLDPAMLEVPRGVEYDRDGRRHMGYLNDCLPDVARPTDENGKVLTRDNYENAVLGILCAKVRYLEAKLKELSPN